MLKGSFLDRLVASTLEYLPQRKALRPLEEMKRLADGQRPARDFVGALRGEGRARIRLIAEVKRASPSKGMLCPSLDAPALARQYERAGAAAVSVLTEPRYFLGSLDDLTEVRAAVDVPLLRKDFTLDPYQVYEARACGADAILLIAAMLSQDQLAHLLDVTHGLGMAALVEIHDEEELERAAAAGPGVIGINNRNLVNFTVDLETTLRLRRLVPGGTALVSESGIHTRTDVQRLARAGVDAILVGEALVTSADPAASVRELLEW